MQNLDFRALAKDAEVKKRKNDLVKEKRLATRRKLEDYRLAKELGLNIKDLEQ